MEESLGDMIKPRPSVGVSPLSFPAEDDGGRVDSGSRYADEPVGIAVSAAG